MTFAADSSAFKMRDALSGAALLGFGARRGDRAGAKAAFVGFSPPTITGFVTPESSPVGAAAMKIEPNVLVSDFETGAHELYRVTITGFMAGDSLTSPSGPPGGDQAPTCGGIPVNGTVYSNDPNHPVANPFGAPLVSTTPATAADVTTFFDGLTFASSSATMHDVTVALDVQNDGGSAPTQTLTIHVAPTSPVAAPTVTGGTANQPVADNATTHPFTAVTASDTSPANAETVTVTLSNAANGTLAGGGFAQTGTAGTYTYAATSAADAQAALQAAVFTPTPNQVAPGGMVTTGFTITTTDGAVTSAPDTVNSVNATSVNDAPTVTSTHASTTSDRAADLLFSNATVTDPDVGQTETATISFAAANGTLTGAGAATTADGVATYTLSAGSATALTTALDAVSFTPTAQPAGTANTQTTVTLSVSDGTTATNADAGTVVTATHTTNTPVATANGTPTQQITDKATAQPFAGVTVTDPDIGQTETATITYAAANGALSGAGLTGQAGSYGLSASSAALLQSALQALVFTPTENQAAPGATVGTAFTVSVTDGSSTTQVADTVTTTSVNDAPVLSGLQSTAAAPSGRAVMLQPGLTIADPDVNAAATSARVAITSGLVAGDQLTVSASAGIATAYDAATGVLTLTGAASDAAYQAALRTVAFVNPSVGTDGSRTIGFTVVDDQGAPSATANETVSVAAAGGGGIPQQPSAPSQTPSQQAGFTTEGASLLRASANNAADPTSALYPQTQAVKAIAAKYDAGQISAADAQSALFHLADGTTSVAEISYAFFTGKTPTQAGLNYLVNSASNPTDLNDAYYARFTTENRYINFAANLATGVGAGAAAFQANYGALSLADVTAKAYEAVFGFAADATKVSAILDAQVPNGLGGTETRAQYFADITGGSAAAQKAAVIGFLLADSVKEGFGSYQQADLHFLQDLAHGTAVFNVDLLAAYGAAPALVGAPVPDQTLTGG